MTSAGSSPSTMLPESRAFRPALTIVEANTPESIALDPIEPRTELLLESLGFWFAARDASPSSLATRPGLRRIFLALVEAHRARRWLSSAELIAVGWPNERGSAKSMGNRLAVALSTLRDLGLRDCLVRNRAGWSIDFTWTLIEVREAGAPSKREQCGARAPGDAA